MYHTQWSCLECQGHPENLILYHPMFPKYHHHALVVSSSITATPQQQQKHLQPWSKRAVVVSFPIQHVECNSIGAEWAGHVGMNKRCSTEARFWRGCCSIACWGLYRRRCSGDIMRHLYLLNYGILTKNVMSFKYYYTIIYAKATDSCIGLFIGFMIWRFIFLIPKSEKSDPSNFWVK